MDTGRFKDLIDRFETAMLVTRTPDDQLRSRPMVIAAADEHCDLWFVTRADAPKVAEVISHAHVNVSLQGKDVFLSLSGRADVVDDPEQVDALWQESWRLWFPNGKQSAELVLIRVRAEQGEYWDVHGMRRLAFLVEAGKALFRGEDAKGEIDHGKVEMV